MYFPKPSLNENDMAIIERGDTAAHSIEAGQYVSWHGKTGKAKAAILQGATLDNTLFDYDEDGVLNASLETLETYDTSNETICGYIDGTIPVYRRVLYNQTVVNGYWGPSTSSWGISRILKLYGCGYNGGWWWGLPYYDSSGHKCSLYWEPSPQRFSGWTNGNHINATIFVEYIK